MYTFVSLEKIIAFFQKYNIDISFLTTSDLSIIILLSNIFTVISYAFIIWVTYKIILKVLDWWF